MLSKEEIEKAKENITKYLNDIWFGTLYSQEENDRDEKILLEYIDQLESDKQKLIEKLEEVIKETAQNSIPKEVVKNKIEKLKEIAEKKDMIPTTVEEKRLDGSTVYSQRYNADGYIAEIVINILKEILEGK